MTTGVRAQRADSPPEPDSLERLVIIGFMGAGKSTVGPMLADRLGWTFVDLDDEVAGRAGEPVHEIIRGRGLDTFRRLESEAGSAVMRRRRVVVAVGGGWPAQPGHMELLADGTLSVWLRVSPATALARIAESATRRPLLEVADPLATAESLLARRRQHYRRGDLEIDTERRTPDEVVGAILKRLTPCGGDLEREETA
ncbi:MAG: shikimate kinase [Gemmatimonadetes bacterium]|nr:shikimate kinase [Gemmatimonadota bacterium]